MPHSPMNHPLLRHAQLCSAGIALWKSKTWKIQLAQGIVFFFFSEDLSNSLEVAGRTELINLNNTLRKTQSLKKLLLDCTLGELQFCINFYSFDLTGFTLCCNSRASVGSWLGRGSLLLVPQQP